MYLGPRQRSIREHFAESHKQFLQNVSSWMFDRILNTCQLWVEKGLANLVLTFRWSLSSQEFSWLVFLLQESFFFGTVKIRFEWSMQNFFLIAGSWNYKIIGIWSFYVNYSRVYMHFLLQDDNIYANYYDPVDLQSHEHFTATSYYNDDHQRYYNGDNERFYYVDNNMCH